MLIFFNLEGGRRVIDVAHDFCVSLIVKDWHYLTYIRGEVPTTVVDPFNYTANL